MITLPYDLGQEVFIIRTKSGSVPCDMCDRTGRIPDKNDPDRSYNCPKCGGYKTFHFDTKVWEVEEGGPVEKYEVNQYGTNLTAEYAWVDLEDVFPDRESAQAEADRRNKEGHDDAAI